MRILKDFDVSIDKKYVEEFLGRGRNVSTKRVKRYVDDSLEECKELVEPKALYSYVKIETRDDDSLILRGGIVLSSSILVEKLCHAAEIAAYIVTIGPRLEKRVTELFEMGDIFKGWILDIIGTYALRSTSIHLQNVVEEEKNYSVSRFSPGQNYWDLSEQKILFEILPGEEIGVELNDYLTMIPRKSVSGIMAPTKDEFISCSICERIDCEYRKAPYGDDISTELKPTSS